MSDNTDDPFDDILVKIAEEIHGRVIVNALGKALGRKPAEVGRCNEANEREGGTYMGTLDMLRKWHQDQTAAEKWSNLKTALVKAKLRNVADKYLSTDHADQGGHVPATPTTRGASSHSARQEGNEEVHPDGEGYYKQEIKQAHPTKDQLDPNKSYEMYFLPKGRMFILNITKDRKGSEVDVQNIEHVFRGIGYEVETYSDLKAKEFRDKLDDFVSSPDHERMCSVAFVIMGHGTKTGIKCIDDEEVTTEDVREMVSGMKSMVGKPKMIFFQCCRGGDHSPQMKTDQAEPDSVEPAKSHVLIVHATTDGNVAYRDEVKGSWFIKMLCEVLLKNAHDTDLCSMLEQVTGKVGELSYGENRQCLVVEKQGISKKIYFLPKYEWKNGSAQS